MVSVDVRQLGPEGAVLKWCEPAKSLGLEKEAEFQFPISVEVEARRLETNVLVNGKAVCRVKLACCRCLEPVEQEVSAEISLEFREGPPPEKKKEDVVEDGDLEVNYYTPPFIDLSDDLRQVLLVAMPAYPVCREDCRGLCPVCGADRNKAPCECSPAAKEKPFEALRSLIQKEQ